MPEESNEIEIIRQITASQRRLYGYILTLIPNPQAAEEILQQTNVVIWEKSREIENVNNFVAWASKIAYFQTLAYLKRIKRNRLHFDDELIGRIATTVSQRQSLLDDRVEALRGCLRKLSDKDRDLIQRRYETGSSLERISDAVDRTRSAIKQALYRIRGALMQCIDRTLATEEMP
jgi:RNA polymerase sigma-70 factor (ECF subfamily)